MDYAKAKEILQTARDRKSKTLENNTRLELREDGSIAVRLHSTDVLTFRPDGSVVYNSGGWRTVTIKARMNSYGPADITQAKRIWYINGLLYQDGCIWHSDGKITGAKQATTLGEALTKRLSLWTEA